MASKIYFGDNSTNTISRVNLDGTGFETVLSRSNLDPFSVAVSEIGRRVYWSSHHAQGIFSSRLDGSDVQEVIGNTQVAEPTGIFIEQDSSKLYWVDRSRDELARANLDGSNVEVLLNNVDLGEPFDLFVESARQRVLITDQNRGLLSYDIATDTVQKLIDDGLNMRTGITVDPNGNILYADRSTGQIFRANSDGTNPAALISGFSNPHGVLYVIPEPSSIAFFGLAGLLVCCRRRHRLG